MEVLGVKLDVVIYIVFMVLVVKIGFYWGWFLFV